VGFRCHTCQACKKSVKKKLLLESVYWEQDLLDILINSLIKAFKDKKFTRMMERTTNLVVSVAATI
jgi:hypothetical protein